MGTNTDHFSSGVTYPTNASIAMFTVENNTGLPPVYIESWGNGSVDEVYGYGFFVQRFGTNLDYSAAIACNNQQIPGNSYDPATSSAIIGFSCNVGHALLSGGTNYGACMGGLFQASGNQFVQVGGLGNTYPGAYPSTQTNIGLWGMATVDPAAVSIGLLATLPSTPETPGLQSAGILVDNGTSGIPLFIARTNGDTVVASLGSSGVWTNQGTVYPSNATPAIPTAAALGAGGFWDGNSNGFKVTVWSDGAATSMKVWGPPF